MFYPEAHTLAYTEHMVVPSLMGAPLLWLGASPVLAHNVSLMLGLTLSGWVMCLVVAGWTGSAAAGVISGLLYAFNAHVLTRFPHLQAQHVEFLPLALFALDRVLTRNAPKDKWLLTGAFVLQALCSNHLLVFGAVSLAAGVAVRPGDWAPRDRRAVLTSLLVAGVVGAILVLPFLWPYYQVSRDQGLARTLEEAARYAAHWQDYLATGGRMHYAWWSRPFMDGRTALFPGITAIVLAGVALGSGVAWRDRRARIALPIAVIGLALSFGPVLPGYAWLHEHTLVGGLRNAARWGWMVLMAVAILAGFGTAAIERRLVGAGARRILAGLLVVLVTGEALRAPVGFTPFTGLPSIYARLADESHVVLVEFPVYSRDAVSRNGPYVLNNTQYFKPLVNGYSGFEPQTFIDRARKLQTFPRAEGLEELRALGATHVTVHTGAFARRSGADALRAVESLPDLALLAEQDGIRLYRLR